MEMDESVDKMGELEESVDKMDVDDVMEDKMDVSDNEKLWEQVECLDIEASNILFAEHKPMPLTAHYVLKAGAKAKFHPAVGDRPETIEIIGEPITAFVLKDKHTIDCGQIVVGRHETFGTFTGVVYNGRGVKKVSFTIICNKPNLLNSTIFQVTAENLCGLKVFNNLDPIYDASGERELKDKQEVRALNPNQFQFNGKLSAVERDDDCLYINSLDISRGYSVVIAKSSDVLVLPDDQIEQRRKDRKICKQLETVATDLLTFFSTTEFHPLVKNYSKISSLIEKSFERLISLRHGASDDIQIDILAPYIRNFLKTAQSLNGLFLEWADQTKCFKDPILQDTISSWSVPAPNPPAKPKKIVPETVVTVDNFDSSHEQIPTEELIATEEDGYHRKMRDMQKQVYHLRPAHIRFKQDGSFAKTLVDFQMHRLFTNFPNESWTMGKLGAFLAGDLVRVNDPPSNMVFMITAFAHLSGPTNQDPNDVFVSMKSFSRESPTYNLFKNIEDFPVPTQQCVYRTASGNLIGPGDRCQKKDAAQQLMTVFVSAIINSHCIYAIVPEDRQVVYQMCACKELIFVEDGPPSKWNLKSVAYNRRVSKKSPVCVHKQYDGN